jgi:hypothetical protein
MAAGAPLGSVVTKMSVPGPSRHLRRATIQLLSVEADTGPLYEYAA